MAINTSKTKWDLTPLLKGDNDSSIEQKKKELKQKANKFIKKWKNRDDYTKKPEILAQITKDYGELLGKEGIDGKIGYYFYLRHIFLDQNNPKLKASYNQIEDVTKQILNEIRFFLHKVSKIPEKEQSKFLKHPKLQEYKHNLEKIFRNAKYLLSEKEEKILLMKSTSSYENWVKMVSEQLTKQQRKIIDEEGKESEKTFEELIGLMSSKNKKVRDKAAEAFNDIIKTVVEISEIEMNSILGDKKIDDELRGFSRPDQSKHIEDDIDTEVVDTLIKTVTKRFNIAKKHYKLKAKLLDQKKLEYHERNVPYGKIENKYEWRDAVELVYQTFTNLDEEFAQIYKKFVETGKIDVYPKKGKSGGAYCIHHSIETPTYIMLNFTNKLGDVTTLAHEAGHGINNELIRKKQNFINFGTPTSTAEVASTFMEDFVLQELIKNADDEQKLSLMIAKLDDDISSIIRQTAFYNFELELHKEHRKCGYLSKEEIGKIFQKHMKSYMGEHVEQSSGTENWWVYVSHFRYFFYVYSYASGLLISKALQNKVKKDKNFVKEVKEFLSAGLSESPKKIFQKMGIDITKAEFWNSGLDEIEKLQKETEKLAKKLGKI